MSTRGFATPTAANRSATYAGAFVLFKIVSCDMTQPCKERQPSFVIKLAMLLGTGLKSSPESLETFIDVVTLTPAYKLKRNGSEAPHRKATTPTRRGALDRTE